MKSRLIDIISRFLCRFVNKQDFFVVRTKSISQQDENTTERAFYDIDNISEYEDICKKYNFIVPDADIKNRFERKQHFCVITEKNHYGCWGWYTTTAEDFEVTEISRHSQVPQNATILFHYYTNEDQRRKGYYCDLLKNVVRSSKKEYAIIYAYDTNVASSGAIKKAGFKYIGRMNHKNFIPFQQMISMYNLEESV